MRPGRGASNAGEGGCVGSMGRREMVWALGIGHGWRGSGEGIRVNVGWGVRWGDKDGRERGLPSVFRVDGRPLNWSADVIVFL